MRVILSRKGFDSSYGGYPSPILPDGTLLSLPIPSPGDKIRYSDLQYNEEVTYYDIMNQLSQRLKIPGTGSSPISRNSECHLDPDLIPGVIERNGQWRPTFGQVNQAQSHLENQGVGRDDLFLFFGWFRQTERTGGKLQFTAGAPDLHIIHGYLQIAEILQPATKTDTPPWMRYHPHVANASRLNKETNTLYVARQDLSWNEDLPGAGILNFDEILVLTKEGETRSIWELPHFMKDLKMTYHSEKSWKEDGSFHSARIGQEFVIEDHPEVDTWAKKLIDPIS